MNVQRNRKRLKTVLDGKRKKSGAFKTRVCAYLFTYATPDEKLQRGAEKRNRP